MFNYLDNFLNKITMYRLTLYCLIAVWCFGLALSLCGLLPYNAFDFAITGLILFLVCLGVNWLMAKLYQAPTNVESVYITAFILMLIISPAKPFSQLTFLLFASAAAMASKYVLAIGKKHLFNPAAFAVALAGFALNRYAIWWTGTLYMAPIVFITGFLIVRKIKRANLVISFFAVAITASLAYFFFHGQPVRLVLEQILIDSPLMFFGFVMLTEPATTPPTRGLQIAYGALVGILFTPLFHTVSFSFSPELALLAGNIFSYIVSPKEKLLLSLQQKVQVAQNTYDFIFQPNRKLNFKPGQYLEWTLAHAPRDARGIRRYFTIASSPTEDAIMMGVKFYEQPSTFKQALKSLEKGGLVIASQLAGDFTLPRNPHKKLVFLAGGIGVTPFRSMVKYLLDNGQKRDIAMFYANQNNNEIAYKELFDQATQEIGIKMHYVEGRISMDMIKQEVPDFAERMFYISGPKSMVDAFQKTLRELGIHKSHIKTDFFPGFA